MMGGPTADQTKDDGVRNSSITLAAANAIQDKLGVGQYRIIEDYARDTEILVQKREDKAGQAR